MGHAYSALTVWKVATQLGGTALLRIEDTDSTRVRPEHEAGIYQDLAWLGLSWPEPVLRQSEHGSAYDRVLDHLSGLGLLYPCSCTRRDILDAGAVAGIDGMIYPGTCRHRELHDAVVGDAIRLNLDKALGQISTPMSYTETGKDAAQSVAVSPEHLLNKIGDPVLRRKDTGDTAYHLACTHDDARQNISHVVRGTDLQALTPLHVLLQHVLGYPTPIYHHHALITDEDGKRLAKIDRSKAISKYRAEGATPEDIRELIGFKY